MPNSTSTLLLVLLVAVVASQQFDVPVLLWSAQSYFDGVSGQETVSRNKFSSLFDSLVSGDAKAHIASSMTGLHARASRPEVIVVFTHEQLRTDETTIFLANGVYANLEGAMQGAKTKVMSSGPQGPNLPALIKKIEGSVTYAGKGDPFGATVEACITIEELEAHLQESLYMFSDGVTDLLIVKLPDLDQVESDIVVGNVNKLILAQTDNYVAIFTAESAQAPSGVIFTLPESAKRSLQDVTDAPTVMPAPTMPSNETDKNWFEKYFPGWFWTQFIVNFTMLVVLLIGICAIADIQVHDRFPTAPKRSRQHED